MLSAHVWVAGQDFSSEKTVDFCYWTTPAVMNFGVFRFGSQH